MSFKNFASYFILLALFVGVCAPCDASSLSDDSVSISSVQTPKQLSQSSGQPFGCEHEGALQHCHTSGHCAFIASTVVDALIAPENQNAFVIDQPVIALGFVSNVFKPPIL